MNDVEQRPLWIRIAKRLLPWAILLALLLLSLAYMNPVVSLVQAKSVAKENPQLWNVPQPLQLDPGLTTTGGKMFCSFGYQFTSPWTEVSFEKKWQTLDDRIFFSGQVIAIWDESQNIDEVAALGKPQNKQAGQFLRAIFGYALRSKILNATPADLHWFASTSHMARSSYYIEMKSLDSTHMRSGLYSFQTPWVRGFQIGSPSGDQQVTVELFDPQDLKFKLMISTQQAAGGKVSQSDINQIISTLRPATAKCE
jgi:hypothetical protein